MLIGCFPEKRAFEISGNGSIGEVPSAGQHRAGERVGGTEPAKKQQRNSQEEHETTSISLTEFLVKNNV